MKKGYNLERVTSDEDSLVTCSGNRDWRLFLWKPGEDLVRLLNERGCYPLRLLHREGKEEDLIIDNLRALSTQEEDKVAKEIEEGDVVFTAVGVKNLPAIAPLLAQGLELRLRGVPIF